MSTPPTENDTENPQVQPAPAPTHRHHLVVELDYVLLPGLETAFAAAVEVLAAQEVPMDEMLFARLLSTRPLAKGCAAAATLAKKRVDAPACAQVIVETMGARLLTEASPVRETVRDALRTLLDKNIALGFVTRFPDSAARPVLERIGFDPAAAGLAVVPSDRAVSFGIEAWKRALRTLRIGEHRCTALVSSGASVKAALATGMHVVALRETLTNFQDYTGADRLLDAPVEAATLVEALSETLRLE